MATIKKFEDLELWQRARSYCLKIFEITTQGSFARDFALKDQINRAAGSIMDNIAEGFERDGKNEFINFLSYAKASAGETRSQLYRALDRKHLAPDKFELLKNESEELGKMIGGFIKYLKNTDISGSKFKDRS